MTAIRDGTFSPRKSCPSAPLRHHQVSRDMRNRALSASTSHTSYRYANDASASKSGYRLSLRAILQEPNEGRSDKSVVRFEEAMGNKGYDRYRNTDRDNSKYTSGYKFTKRVGSHGFKFPSGTKRKGPKPPENFLTLEHDMLNAKVEYPPLNNNPATQSTVGEMTSQRAHSVPRWFYASRTEDRIQKVITSHKSQLTRGLNKKRSAINAWQGSVKENEDKTGSENVDVERRSTPRDQCQKSVTFPNIKGVEQADENDGQKNTKRTENGQNLNGEVDSEDELNEEVVEPRDTDEQEEADDINENEETQVVELQPKPSRGSVLRSLPLQSELDRYLQYLQTSKARTSAFTNSFNRYLPGIAKRDGGPISRPYTHDKPVMDRQKSRFGQEMLQQSKMQTSMASSSKDLAGKMSRINSGQTRLKVQLSDNIIRSGSHSAHSKTGGNMHA